MNGVAGFLDAIFNSANRIVLHKTAGGPQRGSPKTLKQLAIDCRKAAEILQSLEIFRDPMTNPEISCIFLARFVVT
jgi:hypothetical protein